MNEELTVAERARISLAAQARQGALYKARVQAIEFAFETGLDGSDVGQLLQTAGTIADFLLDGTVLPGGAPIDA
jgi:hypothetical protein